jgi:hypothetical protein
MGLTISQSTMSASPNSLEIYRGQSKEVELKITKKDKDVDGNDIEVPLPLDGCTIYFSVVKTLNDNKILISKSSVDVDQISITMPYSDGKAVIYIEHTDTLYLAPGKYFFDVWVKKPDGKRFPVVSPSEFVILPAITLVS